MKEDLQIVPIAVVAAQMGCDPRTAWDRLEPADKATGGAVRQHVGRARVVNLSVLRAYNEARGRRPIVERVSDLETQVANHDERITVIEAHLRRHG